MNPQSLNRYSYASNNPLRYLDPTGQAEMDASSGFWPGGGMPQYDGVSVRSWRAGQDTFFGMGSYTLQTNFSPAGFPQPWASDGFGGGRFGSSLMVGGADFLRSMPSVEVLTVPEVHVTGVRPLPSVPLTGWDWAQQGLGMAEAVPHPFVSTPAGLLNAGISFARGDYNEIPGHAAAAVPFVAGLKIVGLARAIGLGKYAGESIAARSAARDFTGAERAQLNAIGAKTGCHTCGTTNPGTKSGNFVPDHQPPNALNVNEAQQRLYPQCINCSRLQGREIIQQQREGGH